MGKVADFLWAWVMYSSLLWVGASKYTHVDADRIIGYLQMRRWQSRKWRRKVFYPGPNNFSTTWADSFRRPAKIEDCDGGDVGNDAIKDLPLEVWVLSGKLEHLANLSLLLAPSCQAEASTSWGLRGPSSFELGVLPPSFQWELWVQRQPWMRSGSWARARSGFSREGLANNK